MDESQRQAIREVALNRIREKWTNPRCSVCGADAWQIGNTMDATLRDQIPHPDRPPGYFEVYSFVPVFCGNCGYSLLFNAVVLGIVAPSASDFDQQPVRQVK
jgi:hypothetical protein